YRNVTGVQTCALPISLTGPSLSANWRQLSPCRALIIAVGAVLLLPLDGSKAAGVSNAANSMAAPTAASTRPGPLCALPERASVRSEERRVGKEWRSLW